MRSVDVNVATTSTAKCTRSWISPSVWNRQR